ncbi:hypothetical protein K488DRAFT_92586 [Vararia minispora EC-137]|uniref:Uncharacterized protein n=1 Tax=Vararia minispora EC-137 TaxID=1314806 RepID=A0ACB8Q3X7_9AGAM|nr:hypothetical protein K488DRAFT_92586 [Vararia minispora EC-137]
MADRDLAVAYPGPALPPVLQQIPDTRLLRRQRRDGLERYNSRDVRLATETNL